MDALGDGAVRLRKPASVCLNNQLHEFDGLTDPIGKPEIPYSGSLVGRASHDSL
jgi:hypothetical protein